MSRTTTMAVGLGLAILVFQLALGQPVPGDSSGPGAATQRQEPSGENTPPDVIVDPPRLRRRRNVVFLLDRSANMGETFKAVKAELKKTICSMNPRQQFQIILFADGPFEQLQIGEGAGLLHASPNNRKAAFQWLDKQEAAASKVLAPEKAFNVAFALNPELVFLLVKGDLPKETFDQINRLNKEKKTSVYVVAFTNRSGEALLKKIAEENGGNYKFVSEEDLAKWHGPAASQPASETAAASQLAVGGGAATTKPAVVGAPDEAAARRIAAAFVASKGLNWVEIGQVLDLGAKWWVQYQRPEDIQRGLSPLGVMVVKATGQASLVLRK